MRKIDKEFEKLVNRIEGDTEKVVNAVINGSCKGCLTFSSKDKEFKDFAHSLGLSRLMLVDAMVLGINERCKDDGINAVQTRGIDDDTFYTILISKVA